MMTHIPTASINLPDFHADTLGYTFVWEGHFLRGIFAESVVLVRSFVDSGFLGEIMSKGLFPKTWVSEYENEQFGMILEHEMISPVLFATEWNFEMLKDAALMVLKLAQTARKYGYDMVDCHKRNVLFRNSVPMYVDLGSFVLAKEGSTGWNPYMSFLHSYYYILSVWSSGASVIAKRMMAPMLEMGDKDYWAFKSMLCRRFPKLIDYYTFVQGGVCRLSVWGNDRISKEGAFARFFKPIVNFLKPSGSQRLPSVERKVKRVKSPVRSYTLSDEKQSTIDSLVGIISDHFDTCTSLTFINNTRRGYYRAISEHTKVKKIVSIQEDERVSNAEYLEVKNQSLNVCCCYYRLLKNTILVRGQFPEQRLESDLVFMPNISVKDSRFIIHNSIIAIEHCLAYARVALVLIFDEKDNELFLQLKNRHKVSLIPGTDSSQSFLIIYK